MSPDDPSEPSGRGRRSWSPTSYADEEPDPPTRAAVGRSRLERVLRTKPSRGRRVRRTVRHVDPWSVLKLSLLFHAAVFLILCVASGVLWTGARASGSLDNLESFITSVGGFGNCEPIPGSTVATTTTTTAPASDDDSDQLNPARVTTTEPAADQVAAEVDDGDCSPGNRLVGEFKFEDIRIFQAFVLGGVVLVLAGTGTSVVLVLLFNLMSDLTGGVQVWIVEDEPRGRRSPEPTRRQPEPTRRQDEPSHRTRDPERRRSDPGSPPPRRRD